MRTMTTECERGRPALTRRPGRRDPVRSKATTPTIDLQLIFNFKAGRG